MEGKLAAVKVAPSSLFVAPRTKRQLHGSLWKPLTAAVVVVLTRTLPAQLAMCCSPWFLPRRRKAKADDSKGFAPLALPESTRLLQPGKTTRLRCSAFQVSEHTIRNVVDVADET